MLNNNALQELILVTRQKLNLAESAIEKDYYVTQVIHALSGTDVLEDMSGEIMSLLACFTIGDREEVLNF